MQINDSDRLLLSFFDSHPLIRPIIDSYNYSVLQQLPKYLPNNPIYFTDEDIKYKLVLSNIIQEGETTSNGRPFWPFMAKRMKKDYLLKQYADIQLYIVHGEGLPDELVSSKKDVHIWDNLNMLGCNKCWLSMIPREIPAGVPRKYLDIDINGNAIPFDKRDYSLKNVQDFRSVDEDPHLPLGYFISSGISKAVTIQEGLGMNITFRIVDTKLQTYEYPKGGELVCDIRSMSPSHEISHIKVALVNLSPGIKTGKTFVHGYAVYISIPPFNMRATNVINMMRLALYFNYDEKDQLYNTIDMFQRYVENGTTLTKINKHIITTIEDATMVGTDDDLLKLYACMIGLARFNYVCNNSGDVKQQQQEVQEALTDDDIQLMKNNFNRYFYPHIPTDNLDSKFNVMVDMSIQAIKFKMGILPASNKDSYGVKRMNDTGNQIYTLNLNCYNNYLKIAFNKKPPSFKGKDYNSLYRSLASKFDKITTEIHKNYSKAMWGLSIRPQKTGIVQSMSLLTVPGMYEVLRKIGISMNNTKNKATKPKQIDASQFGYSCLVGDTEVLLADGYSVNKIRDMKDDDEVITINPKTLEEEPSKITNKFKLIPKQLYEITTISNRKIKVTADHPFLVLRSNSKLEWVQVGNLQVGDYLISKHYTIKLSTKGESLYIKSTKIPKQYRLDLQNKELINKHLDDKTMCILARLLGYLFTDGNLMKDHYTARFYIGEKDDMYKIMNDIKKLGFDVNEGHYEQSTSIDKNTGRSTTRSIYILNKGGSFAYLMHYLGMPRGNRTKIEMKPLPSWIINASDNVKREFLSGWCGGDGCKVTINNKSVVHMHSISWTCLLKNQKSHKSFLDQICSLFHDLGINCNIYQPKRNKWIKDDRLVNFIHINNDIINMYNFTNKIGYRYCGQKNRESALPIEYIRYKYADIERKRELQQTILELSKTKRQCDIAEELQIKDRLVSKIIRRGPEFVVTKTDKNLMLYNEFCTKVFTALDGKIFTPIIEINKNIPIEPVYDFTTVSNNHSFYANQIIASNCPSHIPDNDSGGLIKQLAVTVVITFEENDEPINNKLESLILPNEREPELKYTETPVYVNGNFMGYAPDGKQLQKELVTARRNNEISKFTSIVFAPEVDTEEVITKLRISTSAGRPVRPLLVVNSNNNEPEYLQYNTTNFDELLMYGAIEFLDGAETEWYSIAITPDELTTGRKFDYLEIHPVTMFGLSSSLMPLANYNTMPRVMYTANMMKQYTAPTNLAYLNIMETGTKILRYPQRRLLETVTAKVINQNSQPGEQNAIVAILPYGYNIEDAVIINKGFLQRGGLSSDSYDVIGFDVDKGAGETLKNIITERQPTTHITQKTINDYFEEPIGVASYVVNASSNTATQNYQLKYGDVVACKTITEIGDNGEEHKHEECTTMSALKGVVDKIWITDLGAKKKTNYRIRIRSPNIIGAERDIGDKVFAEYSQKGVIGLVLNEVDMPRTADGITMDIIINTHSFPSRMTMGYIVDMIFGLSVVVPNKNIHPIPIPVDILNKPIIPNMEGKSFSQLTDAEQEAFNILFSKDPIIGSLLSTAANSGTDFVIPEGAVKRTFKQGTKTSADLNTVVRLAYETLHGKFISTSAYNNPTMINATPFGDPREQQFKEAQEALHARGFNSNGTSVLYSGITGRILGTYLNNPARSSLVRDEDFGIASKEEEESFYSNEPEFIEMGVDFQPAQITVGVISYKALKHVVKEKLRARDTGKVNILTKQAIKGKSRGGGLKFAEGETAVTFSHGAFGFLNEKLTLTDPSGSVRCSSCNNIGYLNRDMDQYICTQCNEQGNDTHDYYQACVPTSFDLLETYLHAYGIKSTLTTGNTTNSIDIMRNQLNKSNNGPCNK